MCLLAVANGRADAQDCKVASVARPLTGYNANIETYPALASIKLGELVEFNPKALADVGGYLRNVTGRGAIPEWYWAGGNCNKGADCDSLALAGVPLGSTGTAEWNTGERRIDDLARPAVIARAEKEMERALGEAAKAGTDLVFRIDNLHDLDDSRFYDRRHVRDYAELVTMTNAWSRVENRLRQQGLLRPGQMTGLTAHNNFAFWQRRLAEGAAPPIVLRFENPTQFVAEFDIGVRLSNGYNIPLIAVEFEQGHLYRPTTQALREVAAKAGVLVVMANEDNYVGGKQTLGPGGRAITWPSAAALCGPKPTPPK